MTINIYGDIKNDISFKFCYINATSFLLNYKFFPIRYYKNDFSVESFIAGIIMTPTQSPEFFIHKIFEGGLKIKDISEYKPNVFSKSFLTKDTAYNTTQIFEPVIKSRNGINTYNSEMLIETKRAFDSAYEYIFELSANGVINNVFENQLSGENKLTTEEIKSFYANLMASKYIIMLHTFDLKKEFKPTYAESANFKEYSYFKSVRIAFTTRFTIKRNEWSYSTRLLDSVSELVSDNRFWENSKWIKIRDKLKSFGVNIYFNSPDDN